VVGTISSNVGVTAAKECAHVPPSLALLCLMQVQAMAARARTQLANTQEREGAAKRPRVTAPQPAAAAAPARKGPKAPAVAAPAPPAADALPAAPAPAAPPPAVAAAAPPAAAPAAAAAAPKRKRGVLQDVSNTRPEAVEGGRQEAGRQQKLASLALPPVQQLPEAAVKGKKGAAARAGKSE
jgi:hypothetical protein